MAVVPLMNADDDVCNFRFSPSNNYLFPISNVTCSIVIIKRLKNFRPLFRSALVLYFRDLFFSRAQKKSPAVYTKTQQLKFFYGLYTIVQ